ncbi:MAG: DUF4345 domain-containing protein [Myxococcota bacterium]
MATRIFLIVSALVWLPYGIFCFFQPGFLEGAAGVTSLSPTGSTELRAMYGGLQASIGVVSLLGAVRVSFAPTALRMLAWVFGGLATGRLLGAALDDGWSAYTGSALGFELLGLGACLWLLRASAEARS